MSLISSMSVFEGVVLFYWIIEVQINFLSEMIIIYILLKSLISYDVLIYYVINHPIKDQEPSTTQRVSNGSLEMGFFYTVMEQISRNIQTRTCS